MAFISLFTLVFDFLAAMWIVGEWSPRSGGVRANQGHISLTKGTVLDNHKERNKVLLGGGGITQTILNVHS